MNYRAIFSLLFLNTDILLDIQDLHFIFCIKDHNIHLEGRVSQNIYYGLSLCFMLKTGNYLSFLITLFTTFDKIKTKT